MDDTDTIGLIVLIVAVLVAYMAAKLKGVTTFSQLPNGAISAKLELSRGGSSGVHSAFHPKDGLRL